jgi:hypothetical protein
MTDKFKEDIISLSNSKLIIPVVIADCFSTVKKIHNISNILLGGSSSTGGKKRVVKQTVKELQAIAVENNIKITKKVDGKTVRLNKKGLIAKLKRYKLI